MKKNVDEQKYIAGIIHNLKRGYGITYIKSFLNTELSVDMVDKFIREAKSILISEYSNKSLDVEAIHINRYNEMVSDCLQTAELDSKLIGKSITFEEWQISRQKKKTAMYEALDTMFSKERCLQMHTNSFIIDVKEDINIEIKENKKIDITKLTFDEQLKLLNLIKKTKLGEYVPASVTPAIERKEIVNVIPEIISTTVNIDAIAHEEPKESLYQAEVMLHPTAKLRAALAREAEQKLNRSNASTGTKIIETKPK